MADCQVDPLAPVTDDRPGLYRSSVMTDSLEPTNQPTSQPARQLRDPLGLLTGEGRRVQSGPTGRPCPDPRSASGLSCTSRRSCGHPAVRCTAERFDRGVSGRSPACRVRFEGQAVTCSAVRRYQRLSRLTGRSHHRHWPAVSPSNSISTHPMPPTLRSPANLAVGAPAFTPTSGRRRQSDASVQGRW